MIARMWRGWTASNRTAEYIGYLNRTGVRDLRATNGNLGVFVLHRPAEDERSEFVVLSLWDSRESIVAFAGEDIDVARFYPQDDEFLLEREWTCEHYDVAAAP